jgi:hypothetical protein
MKSDQDIIDELLDDLEWLLSETKELKDNDLTRERWLRISARVADLREGQ